MEHQMLTKSQQGRVPKRTADEISNSFISWNTLDAYSKEPVLSATSIQRFITAQSEFNTRFRRHAAFNAVLNVRNTAKIESLEKCIIDGKRIVSDLQDEIWRIQKAADDVRVELESCQSEQRDTKCHLEETRSSLESITRECMKRIEEQANLLKIQTALLDKVQASKLHKDLYVDAGIAIFSIWLTGLGLVNGIVNFTSAVAFPLSARKRAWSVWTWKVVLLFMIHRNLKRIAVAYGIHCRIGSVEGYGKLFQTWTRKSEWLPAKYWRDKDTTPSG